jgi:hypothetical protein
VAKYLLDDADESLHNS